MDNFMQKYGETLHATLDALTKNLTYEETVAVFEAYIAPIRVLALRDDQASPKPDLKLPAGWRVRAMDVHTYIVSSPRVNGVANNTAIWDNEKNPAERLLYTLLSTHNPRETE